MWVESTAIASGWAPEVSIKASLMPVPSRLARPMVLESQCCWSVDVAGIDRHVSSERRTRGEREIHARAVEVRPSMAVLPAQ